MDSEDVAQILVSPMAGSISHVLTVSLTALALGESDEIEKNWRILGTSDDENGKESAIGIEHDIAAYTSFIDSYCKVGLLQEEVRQLASQIGDKGTRPIVDTYTFLMHAMYKSSRPEGAATRLLTDMMDYNISLNISLFNILIHAHCKEGMIFKVMNIIDTMRKQGIEPHVVAYNILIASLCDKGMVSEAEGIVDTMEK
ncbi:putative pentatricopeptide repeat-containing protein At1g09680 [Hibiscus syriacus]|uniref:putative pentatricopeptide repeat-containing protein At1g09680 n=1 Tax=Hibiscus syriacus TaxID=106335 RepID=UPI001921A993|nr:putative pentatricopeptide repeat-containing protein At1g09680 [Hibiscus syriacus]